MNAPSRYEMFVLADGEAKCARSLFLPTLPIAGDSCCNPIRALFFIACVRELGSKENERLRCVSSCSCAPPPPSPLRLSRSLARSLACSRSACLFSTSRARHAVRVIFDEDTKIPNAATLTINKEDHTLANMLRS